MQLQIFTVDAFSDRPFSGNPAAVVPHTQKIEGSILQKIASELNLSETAFISPLNGAGADWINCSRFSLRWFTPVQEIPLCGHATLASAHVIFCCLNNKNNQIDFETLSGVLTIRREANNQLVMDFPANPPEVLSSSQSLLLSPLVDASTTDFKSRVQEVRICQTIKYLLIRLDDSVTREELESLRPNYSQMTQVHDGSQVMGVIVCIKGDAHKGGSSKYHVYSRFLAPLYGVNEDPVTGSAHTVLGPYFATELGTTELLCRQCCSRGGDVKVTILDGGRVALAGVATTVISGHINV